MVFNIECKDDKAANLLKMLKAEGLTGKKSDNFKFVTDDGVLYLVYDDDYCDCEDRNLTLEFQADHEPTPRDFAVLRKKIRIFAKKSECKIKSMSLESPDEEDGDDHYLYCYPLPKNHPIIPKDDEEKAKTMKNFYFYRLLQNGKEYQAALDKAEELDATEEQENDRESEDEESKFAAGWVDTIQDEMFQAADYNWSSGEKLSVAVPIQITIYDGDGNEVDNRQFPCKVESLPSIPEGAQSRSQSLSPQSKASGPFCPNCGSEVGKSYKFCGKCGNKLYNSGDGSGQKNKNYSNVLRA